MSRNHQQLEDFFGVNSASGESEEHRDNIKEAIARKLSLKSRLRLLPKVLSFRERYIVLTLALLAIGAVLAVPFTAYYHFTESIPTPGGRIVEGILGAPRLINPILGQASDADRDLAALVYAGLYRYNGEGQLVPSLAKSLPEVTSDGLSYSVTLRTDARWHDGVPVTVDDIIFTVQVAQNPDYGVPKNVLSGWQGVEVERASDTVVIFHLKATYAQFPNNLTLGLLPKHLWQDVRPINFALSELNTKPVGAGPYLFKSLVKDSLGRVVAYKLDAWEQYHEGRPNIDEFEFRFYGTEDELITAFNKGDIDNIGYLSGGNVDRLKFASRVNLERITMPRYFALFFNQNQSRALSDKNVRLALNEATDRVKIINDVFDANAFLVNSPLVSGILDINPNVRTYDYNLDHAASVLTAGGWQKDDAGVPARSATNRLELKITTSTWPELTAVANLVKAQWEQLGALVTIEALPIAQLQQAIIDRNYQILLFGEVLSVDPDPFPFWHSSQRQGNGLNLALYDNPTADRLMEEARQTINPLERRQKYNDFQNVVIEDIPAVFLYSPHYVYGIDDDIKGFDTSLIGTPSDRFTNVVHWYIKTKREFK